MKKIFYSILALITFMLIIKSCTYNRMDSNKISNDEKTIKNTTSDEKQKVYQQETLSSGEEKNNGFDGIPRDKNEQYNFFLDELIRLTKNCKSSLVKTIISDNNTDVTLWRFNPEQYRLYLWFYSNGDFFIGTNYSGIAYEVGKYKGIDSETIQLYDFGEKLNGYIGIDDSLTEITLKREFNDKHFYYEELLYIEGTDDYFGNISTYTGDEGKFDLNGVSVTKFFGDFITNDNVKFRTEPDKNASTIPVLYLIEGEKDFFFKGTKLYVMAKTNKTYKVDGYDNYWYYVFYFGDEYQARGWVYGEFIEPCR